MNTVEDKVRMALRETGEEIGPHTVPPLRLRSTRRGASRPRIPGRWGTWLTPLAAAAAVAAVVAASLAISATFHGHTRGTGQATAARWHGSPTGPASALGKVPPYFVSLPEQALIYARAATVRSTVTGRVLATVRPPRPYKVFTWVSGAADGRTFVLAAQRWWNIASGRAGLPAQNRDNNAPTVFFKLVFDPATGTAKFTRLTVPEKIRATDLGGVGVSPDGTRLALDFRRSIQVVTPATGAVRTWTWPGSGWIGNWKPMGQIFSWSSGGRYLEFQQWGGHEDETMHIRVLDTTAPGTSLTAARVVVTYPYRSGASTLATGDSFLTPDGTRIVTATSFSPKGNNPAGGYGQITGYSARTGRPVFHEDRFSSSAGWQEVLWAGPHGSALVVSDPRGRKTQYGRGNVLGVLAGNKFTPVPHGADENIQIAW